MNFSKPSRAAAAMLSLLAALFVAPVSANPNNQNPRNGLQAHGMITGVRTGVEDAKAAVKRLYALHDAHEQKAMTLDEQKSDPGRIPHIQLSNDFAVLWKAIRDADHLALMGEPAANDLQTKLGRLRIKIGRLAYHGVGPTQGKLKQQIIAKLRKATPNRDRTLAQQQQAIARGQLESAEKALEALGTDLEQHICFLSPQEAKPFVDKFRAVLGECDTQLSAKQRAGYLQQAAKLMETNMEAVALLNSEAARIRAELSASGTAKIGENEKANAADAIEYLTELWGFASAGLVRNGALRWAFSAGSASEVSSEAIKPIKQLETSAKAAIISIIDAAAASTPAGEVRGLYGAILEKLAFIDRRTRPADISSDCEPALQKLAAKDQALNAQIAAYQRATAEALRWRKSFASEKAKQFAREYVSTDVKSIQKVEIKESIKPVMYGAFSPNERPLLSPSFDQPAAWTVSEVSPFLVNAKISTDNTLRISPTSRTSVVPFSSHLYCNVAVGFDLQKEIDALNEVLLVDQEHPALSINAADAISSAKLREFESIGGVIQRVHLEAAVTRFIALPDPAYMLSYVGSMPSIDDTTPAMKQTCWRFDIQPHWVSHKYFTYVAPVVTQ